MFDTNITRITGPSRIDVHEHRQSVADDARLLNELQREAEKRIISSIPLESNILKGEVQLMHFIAIHAYCLRAIYEINGRVFETKVERSVFKVRSIEDQRAFLFELRDEIAKDIATDLIDSNLNARIFAGPEMTL